MKRSTMCRGVPTMMSVSCVFFLSGCGDPVGSTYGRLFVAVTTTGGSFDHDGFTVLLDGDSAGMVDVNESWARVVPEGPHMVALSGLAPNCVAGGPEEAMVAAGSIAQVEIEASCDSDPELADVRILFAGTEELVTMNADGSDRVRLIPGYGIETPDITADGTRLVFIRETLDGSDLWVANADGTDQTPLVEGGAKDPRWSPDGTEIAYTDFDALTGCRQLRVTTGDGTLTDQLTNECFIHDQSNSYSGPSWSADGSRIAFSDTYDRLAVVGREGGLASHVTQGTRPVWAPDDRIAYVGSDWTELLQIAVINADGTEPRTLLVVPTSSSVQTHDWSPDGTLLLYTDVSGVSGTDIYLLNVAERTTARLTGDGTSTSPVFWPEVD